MKPDAKPVLAIIAPHPIDEHPPLLTSHTFEIATKLCAVDDAIERITAHLDRAYGIR